MPPKLEEKVESLPITSGTIFYVGQHYKLEGHHLQLIRELTGCRVLFSDVECYHAEPPDLFEQTGDVGFACPLGRYYEKGATLTRFKIGVERLRLCSKLHEEREAMKYSGALRVAKEPAARCCSAATMSEILSALGL